MAYTKKDYETKKELKEAILEGDSTLADRVVYSPGPFSVNMEGLETIEGPHHPRPHKWLARVEVRGGIVVKVHS